MPEVLNKPDFQVLVHSITKRETGRIYFSSLFLSDSLEVVEEWLKSPSIIFDK